MNDRAPALSVRESGSLHSKGCAELGRVVKLCGILGGMGQLAFINSDQWRQIPPFLVRRRNYRPGVGPLDKLPKGYGPIVHRSFWAYGHEEMVIQSTRPRSDGWAFYVVELRRNPVWVSYFHSRKTGKRVRFASAPSYNAELLAHLFGLPSRL